MINLFVPYYIDSSYDRQVELDMCLNENDKNGLIDCIYLITEDPRVLELNWGGYPLWKEVGKLKVIFIHHRPTYSQVFDLINKVTSDDAWNVLINSDIYTDETIVKLNKYDSNTFIALSRWDVNTSGKAVHYNARDSQDTWCFKGKVKNMNADFFQGIAGCDNAIANRAEVAGYTVINPSKTIKTYHLHNSGVRNYNPNDKVPQPYKLIIPHE